MSEQIKTNGIEIPQPTIKGLTFFPVPTFNDPEVVFGATADKFFDRCDLPDVPSDFKEYANRLFFSGGNLPNIDGRVDPDLAVRALSAWLGSFAPAHESKETTVGYALWVWTTPEAIDSALSGEQK